MYDTLVDRKDIYDKQDLLFSSSKMSKQPYLASEVMHINSSNELLPLEQQKPRRRRHPSPKSLSTPSAKCSPDPLRRLKSKKMEHTILDGAQLSSISSTHDEPQMPRERRNSRRGIASGASPASPASSTHARWVRSNILKPATEMFRNRLYQEDTGISGTSPWAQMWVSGIPPRKRKQLNKIVFSILLLFFFQFLQECAICNICEICTIVKIERLLSLALVRHAKILRPLFLSLKRVIIYKP